mgnify:CR=1 FL=1
MYFFLNGQSSTLSDFVSDDLARAIVISLFSWRRAGKDDPLPGKSRMGWWADTFDGEEIGSKLWLLSRAKLTRGTLEKAREYAQESLQWLIDDGVAAEVQVTAERGEMDRLNMSVNVVKPDQTSLSARFEDVWSFK